MPGICFFADAQDGEILLQWLNSDDEIAFFVPDGSITRQVDQQAIWQFASESSEGTEAIMFIGPPPLCGEKQKWKAVQTLDRLQDGKYSLWHIPAGCPPLVTDENPSLPPHQFILNPWQGWTEQVSGSDPTVPFFSMYCVVEISLELNLRHRPYSELERTTLPQLFSYWTGERDFLVVSNFGWIGNYYGIASEHTLQWWKRLEAWIADHSARIGHFTFESEDSGEQEQLDFWAFPSALEKLKSGTDYYSRGWDLTKGIRSA